MKLRVKLFIPLMLFSLLFGLYFRLFWLPSTTDAMLKQSNQNWEAHLSSITEGLIPLLLENQLANVYENLDALLEQNESWISIVLTDSKGRRYYPLDAPSVPKQLPSHFQTKQLAVGFTEPPLAQLQVTRDLTPLLSEIETLNERLTLVLLFLLFIFMLLTGSTLELQVRHRLKKLSIAANLLTAGKYDAALPDRSNDEIGELTNAFSIMRDALAAYHQQLQGEIDNHRRTAEALEVEKERVSYQATRDPLTGLINRREFERRLTELLRQIDIDDGYHVLLYMDLDQFKIVNDTCGHTAGDALLQQISLSLEERIRQNDSLARLGGDEFGLLLKYCDQDNALKVAESLRQVVQNFDFIWDDKSFRIGISIGAVGIDRHSGDINNLLSAADSACYMAKESGRNRVQLYKKTDEDLARRHGDMLLMTRITEALNKDRFELFCQPIVPVSLSRAGYFHYEILVRMRERNGDLTPPGAFIPAAERYDMIKLVDRWVIDHTFDYLLQHERFGKLRFSINLSGKTLSDKGLLEHIEKRIQNGDIGKHEICFEITESAAVISLGTARRFMESLKHYGCLFSLDDFGRGMSSFSYLKTLPVDYVKIDGSFIKDIVFDPLGRAIVNSINEIAHTMNLQTIAEYVENQAIVEELQRLKIDYAQGFHICMPFPISELSDHKTHGITPTKVFTGTDLDQYKISG
jgi:diguanylate cyclase (GGDEF)-like protein